MDNVISTEGLDTSLVEFLDSVQYFVSDKFKDKWRFKYSELLLETFVNLIITSLKKNKPIKKSSLRNKLRKKTGMSEEVIETFLEETDAEEELFPVII